MPNWPTSSKSMLLPHSSQRPLGVLRSLWIGLPRSRQSSIQRRTTTLKSLEYGSQDGFNPVLGFFTYERHGQ